MYSLCQLFAILHDIQNKHLSCKLLLKNSNKSFYNCAKIGTNLFGITTTTKSISSSCDFGQNKITKTKRLNKKENHIFLVCKRVLNESPLWSDGNVYYLSALLQSRLFALLISKVASNCRNSHQKRTIKVRQYKNTKQTISCSNSTYTTRSIWLAVQ